MIIFLDIDGVLNQLQPNFYIDENCVKRLSIIYDRLHAKIVLTSSWRLGYFHNFNMCTPQIQRLIELFDKYNMYIESRTKNTGCRAFDINEYIDRYNIKRYIVIDDDINEFKGNKIDNLYLVNCKTGLTDKDVKDIIKTCRHKG